MPSGFLTALLYNWRPQGDLNPCCRRERAATPPYPAWICNDFSSNRVNRSIRVIAFCVRFCVRHYQAAVQSIPQSTPQQNRPLQHSAPCPFRFHATYKCIFGSMWQLHVGQSGSLHGWMRWCSCWRMQRLSEPKKRGFSGVTWKKSEINITNIKYYLPKL